MQLEPPLKRLSLTNVVSYVKHSPASIPPSQANMLLGRAALHPELELAHTHQVVAIAGVAAACTAWHRSAW